MVITRKKLIITPVFFLLLFLATPAFASTAYLESESSEVSSGQSFKVDFFLNTEGEDVNAIEGRVVFPPETLELKQTIEGGSIIGLWIEKPRVKSENWIVFSGGLPEGFIGEKGLLFSMVFRVKENVLSREFKLIAENVKVFLNDGVGTLVDISPSYLNFSLINGKKANVEEIKDTDLPESFVPYIGRNPTIYNNQWFVAFSARDKELGIDYYEVWESNQKYDINDIGNIGEAEWTKAENPRLLKDQNLESYIYVKAVDKAGNKRIEVIPPSKSSSVSYKRAIVAVIIVTLLFLALLFIRKIAGAFKNKA